MKKLYSFLLLVCLCSPGALSATVVNKIAAVVNGSMITMYDLEQFLRPELVKRGLSASNPSDRAQVSTLRKQALDSMIMDILIAQEGERLKITVSDAMVNEEITNMMQRSGLPKEEFEAQMKKEGLTPALLRETVRKNALRQQVMLSQVGRKVVVSPEEISAYYESHRNEFVTRSGMRIGLLVYPPSLDVAEWSGKIASGIASFEDVVREVSIGPNKDAAGDMGEIAWDRLPPEWKTRLGAMSAGDVSEVFIMEGHNAQIKVLSADSAGVRQMSVEEAKPRIDGILREPKARERFGEYINQVREKAVIDIRM